MTTLGGDEHLDPSTVDEPNPEDQTSLGVPSGISLAPFALEDGARLLLLTEAGVVQGLNGREGKARKKRE